MFVHDGTDLAPSYEVEVSDKVLTSKIKKAIVQFNAHNNNAVNIAAVLGGALGGSIVSLAVAGAGLFFYKKRHTESSLHRLETIPPSLVNIERERPITNEQVFPAFINQTNETGSTSLNLSELNEEQQSLSINEKNAKERRFICEL